MESHSPHREKKSGWIKIVLIAVGVACLTSMLTIWIAMQYLFPTEFKPVRLTAQEEEILDAKIEALGGVNSHASGQSTENRDVGQSKKKTPSPVPEQYHENDSHRRIRLTQRELNALLSKNTDMAKKLAIHLSDDLASAKLLIPLDPELPLFGGKTLKVTAGMELGYADQQPVAILRGVSVWGVPMPNAWLGGIKNIDLFQEFGMDQGFWNTFASGIEHIQIKEGQLTVQLKP
jgi:hypothetical protein